MHFYYRSYLFISCLCLILNCGAQESLEQVREAVCALSDEQLAYNRLSRSYKRIQNRVNENIETGRFHVLCPQNDKVYFAFIRGKEVIALDELSSHATLIVLTRIQGERKIPTRHYKWDVSNNTLFLRTIYTQDGSENFVSRSRTETGEIRETESTASRARGFIKIETGGIKAETVWPIKPPKLYEAYLTVRSMNSNSPPDCKDDGVSSNTSANKKFLLHLNWNCDDPDGDQLDYELLSGPQWLEMTNQRNARIEGTPHSIDLGDNLFKVSVSDGIHPPVEIRLNIIVE